MRLVRGLFSIGGIIFLLVVIALGVWIKPAVDGGRLLVENQRLNVEKRRLDIEEERIRLDQEVLKEAKDFRKEIANQGQQNLADKIELTCHLIVALALVDTDQNGDPDLGKDDLVVYGFREYLAVLLLTYGERKQYPCPYPDAYVGRVETREGPLVIEQAMAKDRLYVSVRKPRQ